MELIVEAAMEFVVEVFGEALISLIQGFIPEHLLTDKTYKTVKIIVCAFTVILIFSIGIGIMLQFENGYTQKTVGRYMIFIPLVILIVQIVAGIIIKTKTK